MGDSRCHTYLNQVLIGSSFTRSLGSAFTSSSTFNDTSLPPVSPSVSQSINERKQKSSLANTMPPPANAAAEEGGFAVSYLPERGLTCTILIGNEANA